MTIETQTRDVLLRAADEIDVQPPPVAALLGSAARRRRRVAAAVAGLSAAAVVVAVAIVSSGGEGPRVPPTSDLTVPTTAPGTRLVGMDGVMVSAPQDWTTGSATCAASIGHTVFWETGSIHRCIDDGPWNGSSLQIVDLSLNDSALAAAQRAHSPAQIGDVEARTSIRYHVQRPCVRDPGATPSKCFDTRFEGVLYVPSRDVVFFVSSPAGDVVDQVLKSAQLIPDGYVAIPGRPSANELEALGLKANLSDGLSSDAALPTRPSAGHIVRVGSTVLMGDTRPADAQAPVTILSARGVCGPTGGLAFDVTISTERRYHVLVLILVGENVIGKVPIAIAPARLNHVVVAQLEPSRADEVTVQVTGLGLPMFESTLARMPHVPRRLAPGAVCF